jgi:endonuclease-3
MKRATVNLILARMSAQNPHPTTELHFTSNFELLIAVILSAQATDVSVNKATKGLFAQANTPSALLALGEEKLKTAIKSIGLYQSKARHIMQTCEQLLHLHAGEVPSTRCELEALPGVGRKTANVVLNTAFGEPAIAVDTHIFRVANRTGMGPGKTPLAVEKALLKRIDEPYLRHAHHWLVLHGRYVCIARKPQCAACLIRDVCEYRSKN